MTDITMSDSRVTIIRASEFESIKDGLEDMENALQFLSANESQPLLEIDRFLFLDLSGFNIIGSKLIGLFCSLIVDKKISVLALCGLQPTVKDVLRRYGIITSNFSGEPITDTSTGTRFRDDLGRIVTFQSVEEGLSSLIPK
ncbi:STAS domain-containing protein [Desulfosediminicola ganghwensis]|uniref:STAS domain-containing protein n=1 Tax=Desulfosediminicola ganghwensis TaxID=2569540 RepID=UPI0010AD770D|nr:STAS domain-containing protein [Desulfosediminicola ganghwensis]